MRKIESYNELNTLIMKQFRRGMLTNSFLSRKEYESEIANGTLEFHEYENGLLIFRKRSEHVILNFWLNDRSLPGNIDFKPNTVLEIAHRERDIELVKIVEKWNEIGFVQEFRRQRMTFGESFESSADPCISFAEKSDFEAVKFLLEDNFSSVTGCIPTDDTLNEDIKNGNILLYSKNNDKLGLLHYTKEKNKTELRHLCVSESARGQGIGKRLVHQYNSQTNDMLRHVWVRSDNFPAVKLYESCGYHADGMYSDVLIYL